ncbi:2509_t:CDS:2, partial [Paraglomus brasilianum]
DITTDNINFASTFNNLDLNVLSSTKEEMDAKQGLPKTVRQEPGKIYPPPLHTICVNDTTFPNGIYYGGILNLRLLQNESTFQAELAYKSITVSPVHLGLLTISGSGKGGKGLGIQPGG